MYNEALIIYFGPFIWLRSNEKCWHFILFSIETPIFVAVTQYNHSSSPTGNIHIRWNNISSSIKNYDRNCVLDADQICKNLFLYFCLWRCSETMLEVTNEMKMFNLFRLAIIISLWLRLYPCNMWIIKRSTLYYICWF